MKRLLLMAVTVLAAFTLLATLGAARTGPLTGKIVLTATQTEHHNLFPGETWKYRLTTSRRKQGAIGYMVLVCIRISHANTLRQCSGTVSLPLGKITIAGSFLYPILYEFAVTGGTDTYASVRGQVTVDRHLGSQAVYSLTFVLN